MSRIEIVNLRVYQRIVNEDVDVMRKWNAAGCSKAILFELKAKGVNLMRILRVTSGMPTRVYFTTTDKFLNSDLRHEFFEGDTQLFVPFSEMLLQNREEQKKIVVGGF